MRWPSAAPRQATDQILVMSPPVQRSGEPREIQGWVCYSNIRHEPYRFMAYAALVFY
jgi:hypothetical protein